MNILLHFIGPEKVDDIPARDLTEEEIEGLEAVYPEAGDIAQILVNSRKYTWAQKVQTGGQHANR